MKPHKTPPAQDQQKRPYAKPDLRKERKLADVAEGGMPRLSGLPTQT